MIELKEVRKTYQTKKEKVEAIKEINIKLPDRGMVAIVGRSGSGKTTLLNLIGGIERIDSGEIKVNGKEINKLKEKELSEYRRKEIGIVYQKYNLIEELNVKENIEIYLEISRKERKEEEIKEVLKELEIEDIERRKINELSGGQQQRVALAEVILKEPNIILCDEVTGALDKKTSKKVIEKLKEISKERLVIIVSHQIEEIEEYIDRKIEIEEGKIKEDKIIKEEKERKEEKEEEEGKIKVKSFIKILKGWTKVKLKRLIFLGLGLIITFILMLFSISVLYIDETKMLLKGLYENNIQYVSFEKKYIQDDVISNKNYGMGENDAKFIDNLFGSQGFPVYNYFVNTYPNLGDNDIEDYFFKNDYMKNLGSIFYDEINRGFIEYDPNLISNCNFELYGSAPISYDEVVITKYQFIQYQKRNYMYESKQYEIKTYDDIIGKTLYFEEKGEQFPLRIVGIIDTKLNIDRYQTLTYEKMFYNSNNRLFKEFQDEFNKGIHNVIYLKKNFYKEKMKNSYRIIDGEFSLKIHDGLILNKNNIQASINSPDDTVYFRNMNYKNGIIIPINSSTKRFIDDKINNEILEFAKENYDKVATDFFNYKDYYTYILTNEINEYDEEHSYKNIVSNFYEEFFKIDIPLKYKINKYDEEYSTIDVTIIGYYYSPTIDDLYINSSIFNQLYDLFGLSFKTYNNYIVLLSNSDKDMDIISRITCEK